MIFGLKVWTFTDEDGTPKRNVKGLMIQTEDAHGKSLLAVSIKAHD